MTVDPFTHGAHGAQTANGTSMLMLAYYGGNVAATELLRQRGVNLEPLSAFLERVGEVGPPV